MRPAREAALTRKVKTIPFVDVRIIAVAVSLNTQSYDDATQGTTAVNTSVIARLAKLATGLPSDLGQSAIPMTAAIFTR